MTTTTPKKIHYGMSRGLNLDDIDHTTQAEIDTYLNYARNNHVPLYLQTSHTVWLENRPDMMKLHHRVLPHFRVEGEAARSGSQPPPEGAVPEPSSA